MYSLYMEVRSGWKEQCRYFSAGMVGVFTTACRVPLCSVEAPMQCVQEVLIEETKVKNFHCISLNRLSNLLHGAELLSTNNLQLVSKCPTCHANRRLITMVTGVRQCSNCKRDEPSLPPSIEFLEEQLSFYVNGSVHRESNLITVQQDATVFS